MDRKTIQILSFLCALALGAFSFACSGDDDNDSTGGKTATGGKSATGGSGGSGGTATNVKNTFTGVIVDTSDTTIKVGGITVYALNNDDGTVFSSVDSAKSDATAGTFTLKDVPAAKLGVWLAGGNDAAGLERGDTLTFNIDSSRQNYPVYMTSVSVSQIVEKTCKVERNDEMASITSGVYWVNKSTGEVKPVGCATEELVDAETGKPVDGVLAAYIGSNRLPDCQTGQSKTGTTTGGIVFMTIDINKTKKVKLSAAIDGTPFGTPVEVPIIPSGKAKGTEAEKRVSTYSRIYVPADSDPTPAGCTIQ
jgi:hypothetical protein